MAVYRRKTRQINFRRSDELAERLEDYCNERGITMTQFLENSIRQAVGEPLTIPPDALGFHQNRTTKRAKGAVVSATEVQDLEALVRDIVRREVVAALEEQQPGKSQRVA